MDDRRKSNKNGSRKKPPKSREGRRNGRANVVPFSIGALAERAQPKKPRARKGHVKQTDGVRHNPPHEPNRHTRGMVAVAVAREWTPDEIAEALGIHVNTLRKHYRIPLEKGREEVDRMVETAVVTAATDPEVSTASVKAMGLYTTAKMGWARTAWPQPAAEGGAQLEVKGDLQVLIQQLVVPLMDDMSDEQRVKMMARIQQLKEGQGG